MEWNYLRNFGREQFGNIFFSIFDISNVVLLLWIPFIESQPQNPEFRNNPENLHPCSYKPKDVHKVLINRLVQACPEKVLLG